MARQIKRFSPHQTAKVFAILMAISTIPFIAVMALVSSLTPPQVDAQGNEVQFPLFVFFLFPLIYLAFGYVSVAIGCWCYNLLYRFVGGIEVEVSGE